MEVTVNKFIGFVAVAFLFVANTTPSEAQEFTPEVEVGAGYSNPDADTENFIGSVFAKGISFNRLSGGVVFEARFTNGDFHTRTYARSEATLLGPTYAALDLPVNGNWDPRAVFGVNYEKWVFEGYSQIDGDTAYGAVVRWRLF